MTIIFFGTSEFAVPILEKLVADGLVPILVVTPPDQPVGRKHTMTPPPVKVSALRHNIAVAQPEAVEDVSSEIKTLEPDLIVVASYGQILPKELLRIAEHGALNVHPSLLPRHRGPSPVQTTILQGDSQTGVTIILMDEEVDHGAIVAQEVLPEFITDMSYVQLTEKLAELGAELLSRTIPLVMEQEISAMPQDESAATMTEKLKKAHGGLDWSRGADYIDRQVKALNPWPGTFTYWDGKILKILRAQVADNDNYLMSSRVGSTAATVSGEIIVKTGNGIILVKELQLQGGKAMSSKEFVLGHKEFNGTVLT